MSPISAYYGGRGRTVRDNMRSEYGDDEGERVFYATANKRGELAEKGKSRKSKKSRKKSSRRRSRKA